MNIRMRRKVKELEREKKASTAAAQRYYHGDRVKNSPNSRSPTFRTPILIVLGNWESSRFSNTFASVRTTHPSLFTFFQLRCNKLPSAGRVMRCIGLNLQTGNLFFETFQIKLWKIMKIRWQNNNRTGNDIRIGRNIEKVLLFCVMKSLFHLITNWRRLSYKSVNNYRSRFATQRIFAQRLPSFSFAYLDRFGLNFVVLFSSGFFRWRFSHYLSIIVRNRNQNY